MESKRFECPSGPPPFTNQEVLEAFALVAPEMAEMARAETGADPDERTMFLIPDRLLLLLAAVCADHAERLRAFRPDLGERIDAVRGDTEAYVASVRQGFR